MQPTNSHLFSAISAGSLWQFLVALYNHSPNWELVPPLLIGIVALVGVVNTTLNDRHRRAIERRRLDAEITTAALASAERRRAMDKPSLN